MVYKAFTGLKKFSGGGGGWVVHKVIIVSVRVLYAGLRRYTQVYSVEKFSGGGGWVVHKVIIVSVRVLYVRFTQGLRKVYARFMQGLRKVYAGIRRRDGTRSSTICAIQGTFCNIEVYVDGTGCIL